MNPSGYNKPKPINIDGVTYPTLKAAANRLGINECTVGRWLKEIKASGRSEIEKTVKLPRKFIIKKIQ